ncbi:MAG: two pore domain potassium channel family protein [Syntrophus sp. (in: bacteria)]|nr:two pore domain potassium channel family protein [Syntrophus sp. (in: bacteria)]
MVIEGKTVLDAAYFVVVTMATVGYGDISPVTMWGKIFTMALVVTGVGTFLGVIANVTEIMLAKREIESRLEKLNMVIGVFFSEVGISLMADLSRFDHNFDSIRPELIVNANWSVKDFTRAGRNSKKHDYIVSMERVDLIELKGFLMGKRDFLVRLLENPVLMEHQSFTDLLRAVFHVTEELAYRDDFTDIPKADSDHLANDIKRVYHIIVVEWIDYMKYLKHNYPFLFSLAIRTNPFDRKVSVVIKEA